MIRGMPSNTLRELHEITTRSQVGADVADHRRTTTSITLSGRLEQVSSTREQTIDFPLLSCSNKSWDDAYASAISGFSTVDSQGWEPHNPLDKQCSLNLVP